MQNKLFIALDIDGVLNSRYDYSRFSDIKGDIVDLADKLNDEIKFSKMTNGKFCYGNFVNRRQLKMFNGFVNKMIQNGYDVHIVGISSWFSTNPKDIMLLNVNKEELYSYFELNPKVAFRCAEYTIGLSHKRLESFVGYCESVLNGLGKESNAICLYLDDLRYDNLELFNRKLSIFKDKHPNVNFVYPTITESTGLKEEHLIV